MPLEALNDFIINEVYPVALESLTEQAETFFSAVAKEVAELSDDGVVIAYDLPETYDFACSEAIFCKEHAEKGIFKYFVALSFLQGTAVLIISNDGAQVDFPFHFEDNHCAAEKPDSWYEHLKKENSLGPNQKVMWLESYKLLQPESNN